MAYYRTLWPVITHLLVAVIFFTLAYYFFAFFAISAAINKCGTDTYHVLAQNRTRGKVEMLDSVCGLAAPGHSVAIYRISADGKESESILHYSTNTFHLPHATWTPQGEPVLEVPPARFLSTDPNVKSSVVIKFGRVL